MKLTKKEYIVKYLCDKQHTLIRTTKHRFVFYTYCNDFVLKVTKDETMNLIKIEKISLIKAISQLVRNFNQLK